MLRLLTLALLLAASAGSAAHAQTGKKPASAKPRTTTARPQPAPAAATAKPTSDGQGEYVAPGMTGAPNDKVTTDYENRPLKKPAANTSTMSSQPAPKKKP